MRKYQQALTALVRQVIFAHFSGIFAEGVLRPMPGLNVATALFALRTSLRTHTICVGAQSLSDEALWGRLFQTQHARAPFDFFLLRVERERALCECSHNATAVACEENIATKLPELLDELDSPQVSAHQITMTCNKRRTLD